MADPIHVLHTLHRFSTGGMENVIVQLINHLPRERFRHSIMAITEVDAQFMKRVARDDVEVVELFKKPGQPFVLYPRAYRAMRALRPDVYHGCNLAALEFAPVACAAGIGRRIQVEHGWDVADPDGRNRRYRAIRRVCKRFVHETVAVSNQLYRYLHEVIRVDPDHLHLIPNGVDTRLFRPHEPKDAYPPAGFPFGRPDHWVIGTVGRLARIKNQTLLAKAFVRLARSGTVGAENFRLAIIGEGELGAEIRAIIEAAGLTDRVWLPGARADIPALLRALDCFVLPSLAEGTSCTLQEAMATAVPIVATDVGGNRDLLAGGALGRVVASDDVNGMAIAISDAYLAYDRGEAEGRRARASIEKAYALDGMIQRYAWLFARSG